MNNIETKSDFYFSPNYYNGHPAGYYLERNEIANRYNNGIHSRRYTNAQYNIQNNNINSNCNPNMNNNGNGFMYYNNNCYKKGDVNYRETNQIKYNDINKKAIPIQIPIPIPTTTMQQSYETITKGLPRSKSHIPITRTQQNVHKEQNCISDKNRSCSTNKNKYHVLLRTNDVNNNSNSNDNICRKNNNVNKISITCNKKNRMRNGINDEEDKCSDCTECCDRNFYCTSCDEYSDSDTPNIKKNAPKKAVIKISTGNEKSDDTYEDEDGEGDEDENEETNGKKGHCKKKFMGKYTFTEIKDSFKFPWIKPRSPPQFVPKQQNFIY